jgi:aminobutyraldehyde dehydrogenase
VATGGKAGSGNGFFYEPTVIAGARQDDEDRPPRILGRWVFGHPFDDVDDAGTWAQRFRLRACIVRLDQVSGGRWPTAADSNTAAPGFNANSCRPNEMPHGGYKQSATARTVGYARGLLGRPAIMVKLGDQ